MTLLSVEPCTTLLPATGVLVGKLFKTLPVVSLYQTENWLWRQSKHRLTHTVKTTMNHEAEYSSRYCVPDINAYNA